MRTIQFRVLIFKVLIFSVFFICIDNESCDSQIISTQENYDQEINIGLGIGLDYGGFGGRFTALPEKHLALFLGAGYNVEGFGYNVGASYRFNPANRTCFYYTLMYGYNAVIMIENATNYDKTYYGPSTGMGLEVHSRRNPKNFWNFELLVPIRSQEFRNDFDNLKRNPYITSLDDPLPISICLGYHFIID